MSVLRTSAVLLFVLLLLAAAGAGCRSRCHALCVRQVECLGSSEAREEKLDADARLELCETTCDTMLQDPAHREAVQEAFHCVDAPCDGFTACVSKAGRLSAR